MLLKRFLPELDKFLITFKQKFNMIPQKLKVGDEVRVISPSRSMSLLSEETKTIANKRFEELGLKLSFSKNINKSFDSFLLKNLLSRE